MNLGKYSLGMGDRFGRQGEAQLAAVLKAQQAGIEVTPVWNKSHREHTLVGTTPADVRREADAAVAACGWRQPYFVDADHVSLKNVDAFLQTSDFFTLDVADFIGRDSDPADVGAFVVQHRDLLGAVKIGGIEGSLNFTEDQVAAIAAKYLHAVRQAGVLYRHIENAKGKSAFITEVSMDETDSPQTPLELLVILTAIADEGIPVQTIAPKFSGRFNKGVDYVGDIAAFAGEFEQDVAVIRHAIRRFGLPADLKLSIHSGSDKFSIYGAINEVIKKFDVGVHIKTAGTTWLEELIGLALAGGDGLQIAKQVYATACGRIDELCKPYATVIDIDRSRLPDPTTAQRWTGEAFAAALRHDESCPTYNPHLRQLLHVGYRIAAEIGEPFLKALADYSAIVAPQVTENLYDRHIRPIFLA